MVSGPVTSNEFTDPPMKLKILRLIFAAAGISRSAAVEVPVSDPVYPNWTDNTLLRYMAGDIQMIATGSGVVTIPVIDPVFPNWTDNTLLRYIAGYLQDIAANGGSSSGGSSDWKTHVRAASTASGALASAFENGDTFDGLTLATGDRILLKDQSTASQNGLYTVAASGAPTRATDFDAWPEVVAVVVSVGPEGTANKNTSWRSTAAVSGTVGSTNITFAALGSGSVDLSSPGPIGGTAPGVATFGGGTSGNTDLVTIKGASSSVNPVLAWNNGGGADILRLGSAGASGNSTLNSLGYLAIGTNSATLGNSERARFHASGGVSVGNTTDPGATNLSVTGTIELGHATDTTISRNSAGVAKVENGRIVTIEVEALTDAATVTPSGARSGGNLTSLSQTTTFNAPSGTPYEHQSYTLSVISSSVRTISFHADIHAFDDIPLPVATSGGGKLDVWKLVYLQGHWYFASKAFGGN